MPVTIIFESDVANDSNVELVNAKNLFMLKKRHTFTKFSYFYKNKIEVACVSTT